MLQPLDTTCKKPLLLFFTSGQVSDAQWLSRPMIERNMFVVIQSWWVVCKLNAGITWNLLQMCWVKCLLKRIDNSFERGVVPGIKTNPSSVSTSFLLRNLMLLPGPSNLFMTGRDRCFFQENTIPKLLCSNVQNKIIHMYHDGRIPCMCKRRLF